MQLSETTNYYFYNAEVDINNCSGEQDNTTRNDDEGHDDPLSYSRERLNYWCPL